MPLPCVFTFDSQTSALLFVASCELLVLLHTIDRSRIRTVGPAAEANRKTL